jgi:small subunit ribosomal protein S20
MPNSASSKKRHRQSLDRRASNRAVKSALRTQIRKLKEAVEAGDAKASTDELRLAGRKLDKAAAAGVIHKNTSSRLKSRLSAHAKTVTKKK